MAFHVSSRGTNEELGNLLVSNNRDKGVPSISVHHPAKGLVTSPAPLGLFEFQQWAAGLSFRQVISKGTTSHSVPQRRVQDLLKSGKRVYWHEKGVPSICRRLFLSIPATTRSKVKTLWSQGPIKDMQPLDMLMRYLNDAIRDDLKLKTLKSLVEPDPRCQMLADIIRIAEFRKLHPQGRSCPWSLITVD